MPVRLKLEGKRFGRLLVINYNGLHKRKAWWNCICDCGKKHITNTACLTNNSAKSCGCLHRDNLIKRLRTHGFAKIGGKQTRFYYTWAAMKQRCNNSKNPRFPQWGGRGIKVCTEWLKFENFHRDMYTSFLKHFEIYGSRNTTLDRVNNNGNYELSNCRWATQKEQANNTQKVYKANTRIVGE